ncbi:MAG: glutamate--tRNA ligase [Candidatus Dojkabacteria bacterium]|nr:glutamate--tRNA ligase [Candidatus Dojkabacteria bacterium]
MKIRKFRIAPSPTGYLHLGHAKGYLINYALAKKYNGKFILRIEDTDQKRNKPEVIESMLEDFRWLGEYDEGPKSATPDEYYQSQRLHIYQKYIDHLLNEGKAYKAYETEDELKEIMNKLRVENKPLVYPGYHRDLTPEQIEAYEKEGRKYVVRLKVPKNEKIVFEDTVFGRIEVDADTIGDFVIQRSNGYPIYNFAVVVDDHEMGITDVVRGRQHLINTPKQILVYKAFGWDIPRFTHFSDILNENKPGKLSKRDGAKSLLQFRAEGYLPEAILNYIVVISSSFHFASRNDEVMTKDQIFNQIDESKILKTNAKFNQAKLDWMNGMHIRLLSLGELKERFIKWGHTDFYYLERFTDISNQKYVLEKLLSDQHILDKVFPLLNTRISKFIDVLTNLQFLFFRPEVNNLDFSPTNHTGQECIEQIRGLYDIMSKLKRPISHPDWESAIRLKADEIGWKHGDLFMLLRISITGSRYSPPLFEVLEILGWDEVLERLKMFL